MNNDISIKRKLSAIVVTDIAGFTSLSGRDEVYSIEILNKRWSFFSSKLEMCKILKL